MDPQESAARIRRLVIDSSKAIEDAFVSMIPQAVTLITGFISYLLIARALGPDGLGNYALILIIPSLIIGFSDLGIAQTAIRYASRAASQQRTKEQMAVLRWTFRIRMFLTLLLAVIFFVLSPFLATGFWHAPYLTPLLQLGILIGIFGVLANVPAVYFQSLKHFRMNTIILVAQALISFSGILIIAWFNAWSLETIIVVSLLASGAGAVAFLLLVPTPVIFERTGQTWFTPDRVKNFFRPPRLAYIEHGPLDTSGVSSFAFFMILAGITSIFIVSSDTLLQGFFIEKSQIGLYAVAMRVTFPLQIASLGITTALWPRASAVTSPRASINLLKHTFVFCAVGAGFSLIYSIFAPLFIPLIFGGAYSNSTILGQVLCSRYVIVVLSFPLGIIGYNFGLVKVYWLVHVLQLVAIVAINVLLLSIIGAMASAIGLVISEIIGASLLAVLIWRKTAAVGAESMMK